MDSANTCVRDGATSLANRGGRDYIHTCQIWIDPDDGAILQGLQENGARLRSLFESGTGILPMGVRLSIAEGTPNEPEGFSS